MRQEKVLISGETGKFAAKINYSYVLQGSLIRIDRMIARITLNRLLVVTATAGFAFLTADSLIEHWPVLSKEPMSFIPALFSVLVVVIGCITVMRWTEPWIQRLQIILYAAFIIVALGVYFHVEEDDDENTQAGTVRAEKEQPRPLLAPAAFGAVAVVGLLGTARKWHAEVTEQSA